MDQQTPNHDKICLPHANRPALHLLLSHIPNLWHHLVIAQLVGFTVAVFSTGRRDKMSRFQNIYPQIRTMKG